MQVNWSLLYVVDLNPGREGEGEGEGERGRMFVPLPFNHAHAITLTAYNNQLCHIWLLVHHCLN